MNLGAGNGPTMVCVPNAMNERPLSGEAKVPLNVRNWVIVLKNSRDPDSEPSSRNYLL